MRLLFWVVLSLVLVVWGLTDVRNRGRWDPATPLNHMTDLTVYTEAGAAFFDGRDPYAVSNPRGWHYLYPPLLAIALAPLSKLDSQWQVVIWYFFNLAVAWGCCYESLRLLRMLQLPSRTSDAVLQRRLWLVGLSAAAAMLFPALNCLQRGQVGLLVTYFVLLGLRLSLGRRSWLGWTAGGCCVGAGDHRQANAAHAGAVSRGDARAAGRDGLESVASSPQAATLLGGLTAGLMTFLLLLPAAAVGWSANLHHLIASST